MEQPQVENWIESVDLVAGQDVIGHVRSRVLPLEALTLRMASIFEASVSDLCNSCCTMPPCQSERRAATHRRNEGDAVLDFQHMEAIRQFSALTWDMKYW